MLIKTNYDKSMCSPGIVHVGVGAFHRAHQASYINDLIELDGQQCWGIIGVNLRHQDSSVVAALAEQDHSYILKTISPQNDVEYREIGSILDVYDWSIDPLEAAKVVSKDNIHLITITVTESGYYLSDDDTLDMSSESIIEGLSGKGACIYTYLRAALNARKSFSGAPISILSCDNLRHNGKKLQSGLKQFLEACSDYELLAWISDYVTFPSCMVDRITPKPEEKYSVEVKSKFSVNDGLTVMSESFSQWIIQDEFAAKIPPLVQVGVQIVDDVEPYEEAKIRILNGGHTIISYFAVLKGYVTYDEAIADHELDLLFSNYQLHEVIPSLSQSPVNLYEYNKTVKNRFSNKNISDSLSRICIDGASKFSIFILATIKSSYENNVPSVNALKGIASWYIFMRHVVSNNINFSYIDAKWDNIMPLLALGKEEAFAKESFIWGDLSADHPKFVGDLLEAIDLMSKRFPCVLKI